MSAETEKKSPAAPNRRGPKSAATVRAEVEAEMREKIEAEMRAKVEAELHAEFEAAKAEVQAAAKAEVQAANEARIFANEATPINASAVDGDPTKESAYTVHFVDDGLTLLGKVWYRGEELTINPGTPNWEEAHGVLQLDEFQQEDRWGRRFFRSGPWRGRRLDEIDDENLTEAEKAQLAKAAQLRDQRYGALA